MVWSILFVLLFIVFVWRPFYKGLYGFFNYLAWMLVLIVYSVLLFYIGLGLGFLVGFILPKQWTKTETIKLARIYNYTCYNQHFYLIIINTPYSPYFYKETKEFQHLKSIMGTNDVQVFEEKRPDGELKVYIYQFNPLFQWIALDWRNQKKYEFVIPEGSKFVLQ